MRIDPLGPAGGYAPPAPASAGTTAPGGASFGDLLGQAQGLPLSKHAAKRVDRRDPAPDARPVGREVGAAVGRGRVGTAMNTQGGEPRVFTNVDSVVVA